MTWKVRHEGSPKFVSGLSLQQVVDGLLDGHWEITDEVMGPQDSTWTAIENHPQLAEIAADLELPPPAHHGDESHLDMNALIDVCLVLLVFFILTTTYAELQKMMDSPNLSPETNEKIPVLTKQQVDETTIQVKVSQEGGQSVIRLEGTPVDKDALMPRLKALRKNTRRSNLLLDYDRDVPHGIIVTIEDAAKTAGISHVLIVVPKEELGK
jgi:biopolymer transport protein ExbD